MQLLWFRVCNTHVGAKLFNDYMKSNEKQKQDFTVGTVAKSNKKS
jgi:hypothetical protein